MGIIIVMLVMTFVPFGMMYIGYKHRANSWAKNFIITGGLLAIPLTLNFIGLVNALVTGH